LAGESARILKILTNTNICLGPFFALHIQPRSCLGNCGWRSRHRSSVWKSERTIPIRI